jgi:hypothetical protein
LVVNGYGKKLTTLANLRRRRFQAANFSRGRLRRSVKSYLVAGGELASLTRPLRRAAWAAATESTPPKASLFSESTIAQHCLSALEVDRIILFYFCAETLNGELIFLRRRIFS